MPLEQAKKAGIQVNVLSKSMFDTRIPLRLRRAVYGADLLHIHLFPAFYWAALLRGLKIYTEHSTTNRRRNKRIFRIFEKFSYRRYQKVIAVSEGVAKNLNNHFKVVNIRADIVVIRNGVHSVFYQSDDRSSGPVRHILFVGSLTPPKDPVLAIETLALLPEEMTLSFAGIGPMSLLLKEKISQLGIKDRVKFLGEVNDMSSEILKHDIVLSTSLHEGFPLSLAEAQASGIPVVGPNIAGVDEVVRNRFSGLLFTDRKPERIAELIIEATNPEVYSQLCYGAKRWSHSYSIDKCLDQHLQLYELIFNENHNRKIW